MFIVYILYSAIKDKYYIGFTGDDIQERLRKHNSNHNGFTGKVADWRILYTEKYLKKNEAMKRELTIKKRKSRKLIEKLIALGHPIYNREGSAVRTRVLPQVLRF